MPAHAASSALGDDGLHQLPNRLTMRAEVVDGDDDKLRIDLVLNIERGVFVSCRRADCRYAATRAASREHLPTNLEYLLCVVVNRPFPWRAGFQKPHHFGEAIHPCALRSVVMR